MNVQAEQFAQADLVWVLELVVLPVLLVVRLPLGQAVQLAEERSDSWDK